MGWGYSQAAHLLSLLVGASLNLLPPEVVVAVLVHLYGRHRSPVLALVETAAKTFSSLENEFKFRGATARLVLGWATAQQHLACVSYDSFCTLGSQARPAPQPPSHGRASKQGTTKIKGSRGWFEDTRWLRDEGIYGGAR